MAIHQTKAERGPETVRVAGHFGEWLQGRMGPAGPLVLVTVACEALAVTARRLGDGQLSIEQNRPILSDDHARALLNRLGAAPGRFRLEAEMPPGGGAGASTAALVALARVATRDHAELAAACLAVEGASDPLMLAAPDAVLWAPREARALAAIPPLPKVEIVGGFWGAPQRTDPADIAFPDVSDLVADLTQEIDAATLARLASASARRCTDLRGPSLDPTPALAHDLGALGHLRAHTGSVRGLIFAPGTVPDHAEAALAEAGYATPLRFRSGHRA